MKSSADIKSYQLVWSRLQTDYYSSYNLNNIDVLERAWRHIGSYHISCSADCFQPEQKNQVKYSG